MSIYAPFYRQRQTAVLVCLFLVVSLFIIPAHAQTDDPSPPAEPVKLIFIHHSCGENLLSDDNGGLGLALAENNYFVSDTNYGWGPDGIGDRTDITDWPEWFTGPESGRYLDALYNESGQNSWYTRTFADPGGENQIIMFKSCFPNSNLEGSPDDPPRRGVGLTVGNAKAIYNELLDYFATRPDKLFIALTAPPVQDYTYAHNARAFNTWLVTEWLQGYEGSNVAVFDFYNVLTGEGNHHRVVDACTEHCRSGRIEYITDQGDNVAAYPSDDDHPSREGNLKATAEFVPLLNVYYHRWQNSAPPTAPEPVEVEATEPVSEPPPEPETETAVESTTIVGNVIDDFENDLQIWDGYGDEATTITCGRDEADSYSGSAGLHITYDVAPDGWAGCGREFDAPQDWSAEQGITVYVRAGQVGQPVTITGLQGQTTDEVFVFDYQTATTQEAVDGWQRIDVLWEQLIEPSWQGDGASFDPSQTLGLSFTFHGVANGRTSGELWVDDVSFLAAAPAAVDAPAVEPAPTEPTAVEEAEEESGNGRSGLCAGSTTMGLITIVATAWVTTNGKWRSRKRIE
ncbi:MAG: hypothetical protein H6667_05220 [Ardenticatenaceae bacterium]|nr:hypothetical protein [Ardenticatenaceae bacterium]